MAEIRRIAQAPDAALAPVAEGIARQAPSPWWPSAAPDPNEAARTAMARYLDDDPMASGWAAIDDGRALAVLGAALEIVGEEHPGYTYLPPRHASTVLSSWTAASAADLSVHLPGLVGALAEDARAHGIERLLVQTRPHDWVGAAMWRRLGMWSDTVLAGIPMPASDDLPVPRHLVRLATERDEDALVRLAFDEHAFHAAHTRAGAPAVQPEGPTRRDIADSRAEEASGRARTFVVDRPDGQPVGSLRAMRIDLPASSPGAVYLPATSGYIGITSVAPEARGTGVGSSLSAAALAWFAECGLDNVLLHYVDDNPLARAFWSGRGFSPLVVTLAGDVLA